MRTKGDKFQPVHVVVRGGVYHYRLKGWKSGIYRTLGIPESDDPKAAEQAWAKAWEEFRKGDELRTGALTLGAYSAKFYGPECPHTPSVIADGKAIQDRTAKIFRGIISNHLLPLPVMKRRVCDITRLEAERSKRDIVQKLGLTHIAVSAFTILRTILRTAYKDEMIPKDPLLNVTPIKIKKVSRKAFSRDDVDRFFQRENFASDLAYAVFKHCYLSGMRRGEVLSFEWPQIHEFTVRMRDAKTGELVSLTRKKIVVDRAWKDDNHMEKGLPKWDKVREFPVTEELDKHLTWWRGLNPFVHTGLVFRGPSPTPLSNTWWQDNFNFAYKKVFPEQWAEVLAARKEGRRVKRLLVPHSLRHTRATEMAASGMSDRVIQAGMGWTNSDTQSIYTHLGAEHMLESFDAGAKSWGGK